MQKKAANNETAHGQEPFFIGILALGGFMETIKSIITGAYEITLVQLSNGRYVVGVEQKGQKPILSSPMLDLKTALVVFDTQLAKVEGH